jgi:hypothetical protein
MAADVLIGFDDRATSATAAIGDIADTYPTCSRARLLVRSELQDRLG